MYKVSTVPKSLVREAGLHFTLGLPEEEILSRLADTEKVALVALYAGVVRTRKCREELVNKKIRELSAKFSKRDLVKELMQLVNLP